MRPISELATHADDWQALNRACSDTPLLDRRFVDPLLREFASGREVIASFRRGESLVAMGIFTRANRFTYQTLQPSNAPLGLWLCPASLPGPHLPASLTNYARDEARVALRIDRGLKPASPDNCGIVSSDSVLKIFQTATAGIAVGLVGIVGLGFVEAGNLPALHTGEGNALLAFASVFALSFWNFTGIEAATMPAEDRDRAYRQWTKAVERTRNGIFRCPRRGYPPSDSGTRRAAPGRERGQLRSSGPLDRRAGPAWL